MRDLQLHVELAGPPILVYAMWLDQAQHGMITEAFAKINGVIGGQYELWNGVVRGKFLQLEKPKKIVQTWRTVEFDDVPSTTKTTPSSLLTLNLQKRKFGTRLVVTHERIPAILVEQFEFAWKEFYFPRMRYYFGQSPQS